MANHPLQLRLPRRVLDLSRPRIVGILNVTPDSFSDGGAFVDVSRAVEHAIAMLDDGAGVIDIGGESTRPGSQRIDADEQIRRVVPVIEQLVLRRPDAVVSIDTGLSAVGQAALDAGASIINDVWAGRQEPGEKMFVLAADRGAPIILMHMLGTPETMQQSPRYDDVVGEVERFLLGRAAAAERAGVERSQIVLDVGIGFGKTLEHNLALLSALPRFVAHGYAVMLGASRKRFLGALCSPGDHAPPPGELVGATCATTVLAVLAGVQFIRVHDVKANVQAARVAAALTPSSFGRGPE